MASAAAHDVHQDPVMAHEVSRVQHVSIAMEDVMQQVVENQIGHHRAIRERHGIEMVGKSAAVPQVEVWVLLRERLDEVPLLGQVEATRQVPNAEYRTIVMSLSNPAYQRYEVFVEEPQTLLLETIAEVPQL